MRILNFAKRNFKEIIRDPLSIVFAIILPLFLLFIFQQFNIPNEAYKLENFTPGVLIFSFSFITLFASTLIAKDRKTSLLIRLGISPMKPIEYILGYMISFIPIILLQGVGTFVMALILGLPFSINILWTILVSIIIAILFLAIGILIGSLVSDKAASGVSSIVVQLVCFTKELLGSTYSKICEILPFDSALIIIKGILNNNIKSITIQNILIFSVYTIVFVILSAVIFKNKMISDNK